MAISVQSADRPGQHVLRAPGKAVMRFIYRHWARNYDKVIRKLGYRAPEFAADALARHVDLSSGPVLDMACGTGLSGLALKALGANRIDGMDISTEMMQQARKKGIYSRFIVADASVPLPIEDGAYIAALSTGLFTNGHVGAIALEPILGAVRPGGCFSFSVHSSVWKRLGFKDTIERLEREGRVDVLENTPMKHMEGLAGQTTIVVVLRRSAS